MRPWVCDFWVQSWRGVREMLRRCWKSELFSDWWAIAWEQPQKNPVAAWESISRYEGGPGKAMFLSVVFSGMHGSTAATVEAI